MARWLRFALGMHQHSPALSAACPMILAACAAHLGGARPRTPPGPAPFPPSSAGVGLRQGLWRASGSGRGHRTRRHLGGRVPRRDRRNGCQHGVGRCRRGVAPCQAALAARRRRRRLGPGEHSAVPPSCGVAANGHRRCAQRGSFQGLHWRRPELGRRRLAHRRPVPGSGGRVGCGCVWGRRATSRGRPGRQRGQRGATAAAAGTCRVAVQAAACGGRPEAKPAVRRYRARRPGGPRGLPPLR